MIKNILKKETLLLAIITNASYCAAYFYESGYANYFNYSKDLISISIMNLLQMGFGLFMFIFIVTGFIDMIISLIKPSGVIGKILTNLFSYLILVFMVLFISYLIGDGYFKYIASALDIFVLFILIVSFPYRKKSKSRLESLNENIENDFLDRKQSITKTRKSAELLSMLFLLLFFSLLISAIGTYAARSTTDFYFVEKNNIKYVIVNKYNDYLVTKRINKKNEFEEDTYIFNISELNDNAIKKIKIVASN